MNCKYMAFIFYILPLGMLYAQDSNVRTYIDHPQSYIIFTNSNKITICLRDLQADTENESHGIYTTSIEHGVPFIDITWDNNAVDRFLMLSNSLICYLYKSAYPYASGFLDINFNRGEFITRDPEV